MSIESYTPPSGNISYAWAYAFTRLLARGVKEISPLVISVEEFDEDGYPIEDIQIRSRLDEALSKRSINGKSRLVAEVASTIFPNSMWNPKIENSADRLYERFLSSWPRIQKRDQLNADGTYFQRLIAFGLTTNSKTIINQLDTIVNTYKSGLRRRSALQAGIFDPTCDHKNEPFLGFPCLQQVAFTPTSQGLVVSGYYVIQYMLDRGYGNYLGLCWLGRFMANQLGMPLVKMNCFTTVAVLAGGGTYKTSMENLDRELREILRANENR